LLTGAFYHIHRLWQVVRRAGQRLTLGTRKEGKRG